LQLNNEREVIEMINRHAEVGKEIEAVHKKEKIKMGVKYFKRIVLALFVVAFIASTNAEIREYQVREEYAMRDMILAMQTNKVSWGTKTTWDDVIADVNKITTEWVKRVKAGGQYPNTSHYFFKPQY
jgi:hypothetical protein